MEAVLSAGSTNVGGLFVHMRTCIESRSQASAKFVSPCGAHGICQQAAKPSGFPRSREASGRRPQQKSIPSKALFGTRCCRPEASSAKFGVSAGSRVVCSVDELPESLQKIVKGFQMVPDATQRYKQLLYYASKLKPLAPEHRTQDNKVVGCVSQVWVVPTLKDDGKVYFEADSDSQLTKGLAALLVEGLSGATPGQILRIQPDFIEMLGLSQKLTASRNNGFLNMLLLMQKRTLSLFMEQEKRKKTEAGSGAVQNGSSAEASSNGAAVPAASTSEKVAADSAAPSTSGRPSGKEQVHVVNGDGGRPIYSGMRKKLEAGLSPIFLEIEDESHQHAGHAGVHKGASETHFNVKIVSSSFEGMNTVKRHRSVYQLLQQEFANGLHALSLSTKTPEEAGMAEQAASGRS